MLHIDGSHGEGGGQIIRTSLALSLITGKPFRADNVRAGREKPGLQKQHLMSITAAAAIGGAETSGAKLGSKQFTFHPGKIEPGEYQFRIGTAGSTGLVMQTILPPLLTCSAASTITIEGGTHNPWAPPFDFLEHTFLPALGMAGPQVTPALSQYGFYPLGGGEVVYRIVPQELRPFHLDAVTAEYRMVCRVAVVNLPIHIAERERETLLHELPELTAKGNRIDIIQPVNCKGQGNYIALHIERGALVETVTAIGGKGIRAEEVAKSVASEAKAYLKSGAPVGEHLADQLLIPMALAGGGSYVTGELTMHTRTNIEVIKKFLEIEIKTATLTKGLTRIEIGR
ncbi:MAG: RNA 3'-terminal phosphate cyclase [Candidatus Obscuribacterales bacterium]|nr:RNA 3'-terminal phosphate cyclase [Candidatus Obscuribacterales bacterium]